MVKVPEKLLEETNTESVNVLVENSRKVANWFEVDITIKLFGMTLLRLHFPPEDRRKVVKL